MFILMRQTIAGIGGLKERGKRYDVTDAIGYMLIRAGLAERTTTPPPYTAELLARLDDGADRPCLFLPFVGEFGHEVLTHIRLVHFHRASRKVVCCRPGNEVLYPSADAYVTDWTDPIPDRDRIATIRDRQIEWPDLTARYPDHHPVYSGNLTPMQELHCIHPEQRIPFRPRRRGLHADILLGVRRRDFAPERNWPHWQSVADAARSAGLTVAVIGAAETSYDLAGQSLHTRGDTDAAIELMRGCRLYIGTDSGGSHLAATVGAPMLVFRTAVGRSRNLVWRMEQVNPVNVQVIDGWDHPERVIDAMLRITGRAAA